MTGNHPWPRNQALIVATAMFMEHLDGTILVTAAPRIASDFGVTSADVNIAMTAYLVAVATFIPLGGWLASRIGGRWTFCASIVIFTLASLFCALSPDLTALTLSRILQGFGGALMVPVGWLIVLRGTGKADLLRAVAYLTWPALLAPVLAPVVGGLITTYADWQWIFLINVPMGILTLALALALIRDEPTARTALDWLGMVLVTTAVFALVVGMELVVGTDRLLLGGVALVGAAAVGIAAVRWLLRASHPLLNVRVFQISSFRAANTGGFLFRLSVTSAPFLLPLMFQDAFGWTPIESGLLVTAVFIGNIAVKPATTPMLRVFGFKSVLVAATGGSALSFVLFTLLTVATPFPVVFGVLLVSGVFRSIGFTAYNSLQFADVQVGTLESANTLSATLGQLATGLGIAVAASVLRLVESLLGATAEPGPTLAFHVTFGVMAALTLVAVVGAVLIPAGTAAEVRGRAVRSRR